MDHLDLRDMMANLVSLVCTDHLVDLDPMDHQDRKEDKDNPDHKENQDHQETMSTLTVLHQEAKEIVEHQVLPEDRDNLEFLDLKEILAYLLMALQVSQVTWCARRRW